MIPADLNGDAKMDFVVLLAQEYETVLAYINKGSGDFSFDQKVIYAAPHPNWGSSGIQLVDLDNDKDLDVLLTHGDTFDDGIVKPYHGIQWLENTGSYPFVEHTLAQMPGVHRAQAADLDGDGDLDVVAAALLAGGSDVDETLLPALVWLEQTTPGHVCPAHDRDGDSRATRRSTSATSTATATSTSSSATSFSSTSGQPSQSMSGRIRGGRVLPIVENPEESGEAGHYG